MKLNNPFAQPAMDMQDIRGGQEVCVTGHARIGMRDKA